MIRAIRGAITVEDDTPAAILSATRELLLRLAAENELSEAELVSILFTATPDLVSCFPARAARDIGWTDTPLMCAVEMDVVDALPRCIRVLCHVETDRDRDAIQHVYLRKAKGLRPDWNPKG